MVGGVPCSGKSSLTRNILSELGSAEYVEPMKLFPCEQHGNILVVGHYPEGESFGGTDRMSYGAISKFRDFINQEESKHKHIFLARKMGPTLGLKYYDGLRPHAADL